MFKFRMYLFGGAMLVGLAGMMLDPRSPQSVFKKADATPVQVVEKGNAITRRSGEPDIITYKRDNAARILQATDEARAHLAYFWEHREHPGRGEAMFQLKVAFPVTNEEGEKGREHIWVKDVVKTSGGGFAGRLDNEPIGMPGKHSGDMVDFTALMISDWGFLRREKLIGFYTSRVQLQDDSSPELARFRARLGENPV